MMGKLTGKSIAQIIIQWAIQNGIHPDKFETMSIPELIKLLEKDDK